MTDKRRFQRVVINAEGTLSHSDIAIDVTVLDISLRGLRLLATEQALSALPFDSHEPYSISFRQNEDSPPICAWLEQLYRQTDRRGNRVIVGCRVEHIEVEDLAGLRRLIELNSRDAELSEQDLDALIETIYSNASSASDN